MSRCPAPWGWVPVYCVCLLLHRELPALFVPTSTNLSSVSDQGDCMSGLKPFQPVRLCGFCIFIFTFIFG